MYHLAIQINGIKVQRVIPIYSCKDGSFVVSPERFDIDSQFLIFDQRADCIALNSTDKTEDELLKILVEVQPLKPSKEYYL